MTTESLDALIKGDKRPNRLKTETVRVNGRRAQIHYSSYYGTYELVKYLDPPAKEDIHAKKEAEETCYSQTE